MSFFDPPPAPETKWEVPAITAGTPQTRNFTRWGRVRYPYRTEFRIDNHRGSTTLTFNANGITRTIGPGAVVTVKRDAVGLVGTYTLDSDANVAADTVVVYENGGLSRAD